MVTEAAIMLCYSNLKELQMAVIVSFVMDGDVFGILPLTADESTATQLIKVFQRRITS